MMLPDARYSVKIRGRMVDEWVTVVATDNLELACSTADTYHKAGNYSCRVWDNVIEEWVN
jgi:hypothetical protein